jgi:hypothetical protein
MFSGPQGFPAPFPDNSYTAGAKPHAGPVEKAEIPGNIKKGEISEKNKKRRVFRCF